MAEDEVVSADEVRRSVVRWLAAAVLFVLAGSVAVLTGQLDPPDEDENPSLATTVRGGPLPGTTVMDYVSSRALALDQADGRWVATVSLRAYLTEADARRRLAEADVDVKALLVAAPGGEPATVTGSLERWAQQARVGAEEERRQLQSMAATTDDAAFRAQFHADAERLAKLLAGVDPKGAIVFGAVVEGDAADLKELAEQRQLVRLVDLVGTRAPGPVTNLRGVRPEEVERVGSPPNRPV